MKLCSVEGCELTLFIFFSVILMVVLFYLITILVPQLLGQLDNKMHQCSAIDGNEYSGKFVCSCVDACNGANLTYVEIRNNFDTFACICRNEYGNEIKEVRYVRKREI